MDERPLFDLDALGAVSRRLACAVFQVFPELVEHATSIAAAETDGLTLQLRVPSPTGDADRAILMTVCAPENGGATLDFGPNHIHAAVDDEDFSELVEWLAAILEDRLLIAKDPGLPGPWDAEWLDLRETDALEDYLTDPEKTGRVTLKSWSGKADRDVSSDML
jgi:hypothetical protein